MQIVISLYTLTFLAAFLVNILFSFIVFFQNPGNSTNRILSALMFALAVWSLGDAALTVSQSESFSMTVARMICGLTPVIPCIYLHFVMIYPSKKYFMRGRAAFVLLYAPVAVSVYLAWFTNLLVMKPFETSWAKHYFHYGPALIYYSIFFIVSFMLANLLLGSVLVNSRNMRERFQSKWFIIACSVPILGGILSNLIFPMAGAVVFPLASPLTALTSIMIAYAMLRYRIMSSSVKTASEIIISMLPGVVVFLDAGENIISANKRFYEILGYTPGELLGHPVASILADDSRKDGLPMQKWEEKTQLQSQQLKFKTKNGEPVVVSFSGTIVTDETSDIVGLVGMGFPVKGNQ